MQPDAPSSPGYQERGSLKCDRLGVNPRPKLSVRRKVEDAKVAVQPDAPSSPAYQERGSSKCDRPDLNRRLPDLQSGTLPAELLSLMPRGLRFSLQVFWPSNFTLCHQGLRLEYHESASSQFLPSPQAHSIVHENKLILRL